MSDNKAHTSGLFVDEVNNNSAAAPLMPVMSLLHSYVSLTFATLFAVLEMLSEL